MNASPAIFSVAYEISAILNGAHRELGFPPFVIFTYISTLITLLTRRVPIKMRSHDRTAPKWMNFPGRFVLICGGIVLFW